MRAFASDEVTPSDVACRRSTGLVRAVQLHRRSRPMGFGLQALAPSYIPLPLRISALAVRNSGRGTRTGPGWVVPAQQSRILSVPR